MPRRFFSVIVLLALPRSPTAAQLPSPPVETWPAAAPAAPSCGLGCPARTVESTQVLLVPHERATTRPDWTLRGGGVPGPGRPCSEFREERRVVTELRLEAQEVSQQVVCDELKPVTVIDCVTGRPRTEYQTCPVVKTVRVKVYSTVPVERQVVVRRAVPEAGGGRDGPEVGPRPAHGAGGRAELHGGYYDQPDSGPHLPAAPRAAGLHPGHP